MNNKGQTLVVFIMLLPFMCLLIGFIIDKCYLLYREKELKDIASIVCEYALDESKMDNEIKQLALENDKNIKNIQIIRKDNNTNITLSKNQKSMFSKLIGKDFYKIKVEISCIE